MNTIPMTIDEVHQITRQIAVHLREATNNRRYDRINMRHAIEKLSRIKESGAWRLMSHAAFDEYVTGELGYELQEYQEQCRAADIERNLSKLQGIAGYLPGMEPVGDSAGWLKDSQAKALENLTPEQQREVYQQQAEQGDLSAKGLRAEAARKVFSTLSPDQQKAIMEEEERRAMARQEKASARAVGIDYVSDYEQVRKSHTIAVKAIKKCLRSATKLGGEADMYLSSVEPLLESLLLSEQFLPY